MAPEEGVGLSAFAKPVGAIVHETHFLTFDTRSPLRGGTTLPAGTYLFSWNLQQGVTRISSEDRSKVYTTLQAMPVPRQKVKEHDIVFERTPANAPPTLEAWFCPGNPTGTSSPQ